MPLIVSKRSFIKSLFIAPAIVASQNIMPVKAFNLLDDFAKSDNGRIPTLPVSAIYIGDYNQAKLITDIEEIQEASATLGDTWSLVQLKSDNEWEPFHYRWMSSYHQEQIKFKHQVIKTLDVPQTNRQIDTTVALMKAHANSAVIWELPCDMRK